jgi:hypothetical protein
LTKIEQMVEMEVVVMRIYQPAGTVETLERLLADPEIQAALVEHRVLPEREARVAPFPEWLDRRLVRGLHAQGIEMLYTHQAEALEALHEGKDIVVITPTASGKSLCYGLPVLQRGPVGDPSASGEACFFSEKVESAQNAGWDAVIIANHHAGAAETGHASHLCGSQGHAFTPTIPAVCVGHSTFHLMFNTAPNFTYPEASPAIGEEGERVSHTPIFNGWGYVHLYNATTLQPIDQFAVPEAHDPDFAFGFGDLTVHEVATHPTQWDQAYLSYYSAGLRSLEIQGSELVETGGYLDPQGNDFWGVEVFVRDDRPIVLGSDRDRGLWIFEDTNP